MFELAQQFCLPGNPSLPNEDTVAFGSCYCFAMDGASCLSGINVIDRNSDAAWMVQRVKVGLCALLDAGDPRSDDLAADYTALVDAMIPFQAGNGLFHDVLDDDGAFYESETSEMFAYSIYSMVLWNKVDDRYLERADLARRAVEARVDAEGILQGCAGSPTFEREGTSVEAQAHLIMMEAAARRLGR